MILLMIVNVPEFFLSHRLAIAVAAKERGFDVHIAGGSGCGIEKIRGFGFTFHHIQISRSGRNPLREALSLWSIYILIRRIDPDVVHLVSTKPVIYGGIAARMGRARTIVAAISGLGTVFIRQGIRASILRWIIKYLYVSALRGPNTYVIVQNSDDQRVLQSIGAVCDNRTVLVRGSGVDLSEYCVVPEIVGVPVVTYAGRLLADKGVREFVAAAQLLRSRGLDARFWLAGDIDVGNLTSVSSYEVMAWRRANCVEVLGYQDDICDVFGRSHIVTLPSYREGLPKVLIEASACGRAIVTTDVPGCRDAIVPGETGLLVPVRNVIALADAIQELLEDPERRKKMGMAGRVLAEKDYGIDRVVRTHLDIYGKADASDFEG